MGIDATRKWASEGFTRPWPTRIRTTPEAAPARGRDLERESGRAWHSHDTRLTEANLIAVSAREADEERRRRHGVQDDLRARRWQRHCRRDSSADARPGVTAGELRVIGKPASADEAVAAVKRLRRPQEPCR